GPEQPLPSPEGLTLPYMTSSELPAIDPGDRRSSSRTTLSAGDGATSSGPIAQACRPAQLALCPERPRRNPTGTQPNTIASAADRRSYRSGAPWEHALPLGCA